MHLQDYIKEICEKSATIEEIFGSNFRSECPNEELGFDASEILANWCLTSTGGNWENFNKLLALRKLSQDEVISRLYSQPKNFLDPNHLYRTEMESVFKCLTSNGVLLDKKINARLPFIELYTTLVHYAYQKLLLDMNGRCDASIPESVYREIASDLFKNISDLLSEPLFDTFQNLKLSLKKNHPNIDSYKSFIFYMIDDGFYILFRSYPVLLRVLTNMIMQWIESNAELISRLNQDLSSVSVKFKLTNQSISQVESIQSGLSDPHNFGRTVKIISFINGEKIVYKPKNLGPDKAWEDLIDSLNAINPPVNLKACKILAFKDYGWTEYHSNDSCKDASGINSFYFRSGAQLAIFYLLASTDMHEENIIAAGEYPIPIDLEMLLQPDAKEKRYDNSKNEAHDFAIRQLADSVLSIGILPSYSILPNNVFVKVGALNSSISTKIRKTWIDLGTEKLNYKLEKTLLDDGKNIPKYNSEKIGIDNFVGEFTKGFESYLKFIAKISQENNNFLLKPFKSLPVRKIFRPTIFYGLLIDRLKNYKAMKDGVTWSIQAEFIFRSLNFDLESDPYFPIYMSEKKALLDLCFPHFTCLTDNSNVYSNSISVLDLNAENGILRALQKIEKVGEAEISKQLEIIRNSFSSISNVSNQRPATLNSKTNGTEDPALDLDNISSSAILELELNRIYKLITTRAIICENSAAWIGLQWQKNSSISKLSVLDHDIYNGSLGIAIFLAAHSLHTNCNESRNITYKSLSATQDLLRSSYALRWARTSGIGGLNGVGSLVYGFGLLANILDDDTLLLDAELSAQLITPELISTDKDLDVLGGSAGTILALLRLYCQSSKSLYIEKAIQCGEHILKQDKKIRGSSFLWAGINVGANPINGMSHGAAGFSAAFSGLAKFTNRDDFSNAAVECIEFENVSFSTDKGNWPDYRPHSQMRWVCQWCHGACGIGLSRLLAKEYGLDSKVSVDADINNAIICTEANWPNNMDTLCCGTMGSIELLREAGKHKFKTGKSTLMMILEIHRRSRNAGDYLWASGDENFNLSLFNGISGIGYTILRELNPSLPNILIFK